MAFLFEFRSGGLYRSENNLNIGEIPYIKHLDVIHNRSLRTKDINTKVECTEKELSQFSAKYGDVFFSQVGVNLGRSSVLLNEINNCVCGANLMRARPKTDLLLPEYCVYCFSTHEFEKYIVSKRKKGAIESLDAHAVANYLLPLPSIETQQKIASMLDLFQELQTGTISGIQAEIDLRVKQYEYYRDFLLQFD